MRSSLKVALLLSSAFFSVPAVAQNISQPIPPERYSLDARGVDLVSGYFNFMATEVAIGNPDNGGLAHTRGLVNLGWLDANQGAIHISGSTYTVVLGAQSEVFTLSGGVFTPAVNRGSTLTQSGVVFFYTTASGTTVRYSPYYCYSATGAACTNRALISEIVEPNGQTTNYNYVSQTYVRSTSPVVTGTVARLQSITNNRGYQLHYKYKSDTMTGTSPLTTRINNWLAVETVTGVNNAVDYCGATSASCSFSRVWPSVTYTSAVGGPVTSATDQSGRTTQYLFATSGELSGIRYPGSSANDVTVATSSPLSRVTSLTDATGTWNYNFTDSGAIRTAVSTGPNGQSTTVVSDLTVGRPSTITDALGRVTRYSYYSLGTLYRVFQPEGDYIQLIYDSRGNVTQTLSFPKVGSGLPTITTSATFPATCANPVTCNLPASTTDARGAVTNYTYDETHGGVLSVLAPAPTTGAARPETRIAYAAQTAYYKNSTGSIVAAPSSVILQTALSTCAAGTSPACLNTANESRTVVTYGSVGVANNLSPTVVANRDGTGTLSATTTMTYTPNGDVASVDGPLSGTADTTTYRFDDARQLVGVIGPDPDGGGALLRRAQRVTYNPRGAVALVEQGTVTGLTDPNWAAFSSLQQIATAYDALGRPTHQRLQADGTTYGLIQTGYDASGRIDCVTQRMNPAAFASPPASACTLATAGAFGPDRTTKYGYDAAGQLTSTTSGYSSGAPITESATYTANGLPLTLTDGNGNVSTLVYDGFDRLRRLRYPNKTGGGSSTSDYEEYGYDAGSNVTSYRTRLNQTFSLTYDALNRQTLLGAPSGMAGASYSYDNLGRLLTASNGVTNSRVWDALSRLTSETGPLGTMSYQYDLAGRRTRQTWPDTFFVTNSWDLTNELTAVLHGGTTQIVGMTYDNLGRRIGISRSNGASTSYGYDGASRLISLGHDVGGSEADVAFTYAYNPAGQISSKTTSNNAYLWTPPVGSTAYTLNGLNQVTAAGGAAFTYDDNGNLTNDGVRPYAYDPLGRLTGSGSASLTYDAFGRLDNYVGTSGARYLYDGVEAVGFSTSGTTLNTRFIRGPGTDEVLASYTSTGPTPAQFWMSDERGSLVDTVNGSTGASTAINTYDEYGIPGPGNVGRFQYTGQLWLPSFGAYHFKARAYQPTLGRFQQADPIGYLGGANLYNYVLSDPVNNTDPSGTVCVPCVGFLAGGLVGGGLEAWSQWVEYGHVADWNKVGIQALVGGASGASGAYLAGILAPAVGGIAAAAIGGGVSNAAGSAVSKGLDARWRDGNARNIFNASMSAAGQGFVSGLVVGAAISGIGSVGSGFSREVDSFSPLVQWQPGRDTLARYGGAFGSEIRGTVLTSVGDVNEYYRRSWPNDKRCGMVYIRGQLYRYCVFFL